MPPDARTAVASVKVVKRNLTSGDGGVDEIHEVRFWDKMRALEQLAKQFGLAGRAHRGAARPASLVAGRRSKHSLLKARRPALDRLMLAARRRQLDAFVCWRLDRLGRDLAHLLAVVNEWTALGVACISLGEGIDATTPAGALPLQILGATGAVRARTPPRAHPGWPGARQARGAPFGSATSDGAA